MDSAETARIHCPACFLRLRCNSCGYSCPAHIVTTPLGASRAREIPGATASAEGDAGRVRAKAPSPRERSVHVSKGPVTAGAATAGQRGVPVLLSVNVGLPRTSPGRAGRCTPACGSTRCTGPAMVRRLNIDGDGQGDTAGHGGEQRAVLVYQVQSYRYWQQHFGRTTSATGSSARTSPSTACPTTRSASATGTASARPSSR